MAYKRVEMALLFACYTGLRRSELVKIRRKDIDLKAGTFRAIKTKGRGQEKVSFEHHQKMPAALLDKVRKWMDQLPQGQQCLFTDADNHLDGDLFDEKACRIKSEKLGANLTKLLGGSDFEHVSGWHVHRHNFASILTANGASPEEGAAIIGHKSTVMFQHYSHKSLQQRDVVVDKIGNLTGP